MTAKPKGLRGVLWASLEGKTNDGQRMRQIMDSRTPTDFEQVSSGGKQTKVSGEEGIREDQTNSGNAMSNICSQTTVSGEGGIREDRAHAAKGKRTTVREYVEAGRLENQPPSINAICVYTAQVYKARVKQQPGKARYDTDSKLIRIDEEDSPKLESVAAEFLKKHHCLNHLSMA
jgi:hypothetical protein